uniref:tRNA:m(4)X modification enzyme TRM13 n=1 Tax=Chromera velia CCMP2878 TaxID=1169474 RepID=A0A0G4IER8_9ALVE|eukprot:Cvel_2412.t1-p1 / transcript=Cvel_2412.t1 / gene=Cvel_2412 / organism=Chromera_velia_CCMP2878 / gene_product=tRNA:m(4)X modification enzyme TRM13, putative / transcript_product=tRNA:m(4)X modification enzyme TRM13, putative / location=Cvel_scaffold94:42885-49683(-) / protein_length=862 / sequence_SO=supercontig / SO=protein_coding / is_pseudo=false
MESRKTHQPETATCAFFIKRKNKTCKFDRVPGELYCSTHRSGLEDGGEKERVPCPIDPSHSIYKSRLLGHIKNCNKARDFAFELCLPFTEQNCNVDGHLLPANPPETVTSDDSLWAGTETLSGEASGHSPADAVSETELQRLLRDPQKSDAFFRKVEKAYEIAIAFNKTCRPSHLAVRHAENRDPILKSMFGDFLDPFCESPPSEAATVAGSNKEAGPGEMPEWAAPVEAAFRAAVADSLSERWKSERKQEIKKKERETQEQKHETAVAFTESAGQEEEFNAPPDIRQLPLAEVLQRMEKHEKQNASLTALCFLLDLATPSPPDALYEGTPGSQKEEGGKRLGGRRDEPMEGGLFVEFGAGRAALTRWLSLAASSFGLRRRREKLQARKEEEEEKGEEAGQGGVDSCFVVVEREARRNKQEAKDSWAGKGFELQTELVGPPVDPDRVLRLRCDIRHFSLSALLKTAAAGAGARESGALVKLDTAVKFYRLPSWLLSTLSHMKRQEQRRLEKSSSDCRQGGEGESPPRIPDEDAKRQERERKRNSNPVDGAEADEVEQTKKRRCNTRGSETVEAPEEKQEEAHLTASPPSPHRLSLTSPQFSAEAVEPPSSSSSSSAAAAPERSTDGSLSPSDLFPLLLQMTRGSGVRAESVREQVERALIQNPPKLSFCLGVAKHLCGAGLDASLRCMVNAAQHTCLEKKIEGATSSSSSSSSSSGILPLRESDRHSVLEGSGKGKADRGGGKGNVGGVVLSGGLRLLMAPCCHHRCEWGDFCGRSFLETECGLGKEDFGSLAAMCGWATGALGERQELGFKAKRILDIARVSWLRSNGFPEAFLIKFTDRKVSPENVVIVASTQRKKSVSL